MSENIDLNTVSDEETLITALNALVRTAYENDIKVEGCYTCRNNQSHPDWDITVAPVQKIQNDRRELTE